MMKRPYAAAVRLDPNRGNPIMARRFPTLFILFVLLHMIGIVGNTDAQEFPEPVGYVNDFARVIAPRDERLLESIARSVEEVTGAEIAVVTLETLGDYPTIEELSLKLANEWGVGKQDENNGIVISLIIRERKTRIEVGIGLEEAITDEIAGRILDTWMLPAFRNDKFGDGLIAGVISIAHVLALWYEVPVPLLQFR